jgi:redox-sensitive bicupin YhaK (pirin superfamily)
MTTDSTIRSVARITDSVETLEGEGFLVHRPFPTEQVTDFDPFLLLDEMGPMDLGPGEAKGAPDHPHRGFETVTYMLEGRFEHKDSAGNRGRLDVGDVQWMTAGAGVVHSEIPAEEIRRDGGRIHGMQLWVNLPSRDKMMAPRYQEIPAGRIPEATSDDGLVKIRIIAGEALGQKAVIDTRTPIIYLHYTLEPGGRAVASVPREYNTFAYVLEGPALFGDTRETGAIGQMVVFDQDGDSVAIEASESGPRVSVLLLAGVPLGEPVARYGPFVMNTREEIVQAVDDFRSGKMGLIQD